MTLFVKNMVCDRCIMAVQDTLTKLDLEAKRVTLGKIEFIRELSANKILNLESNLNRLGFELIDDKKSRTIEKIKSTIIHLVHHQNDDRKTNLSDLLSKELNHDYNYLSNLFSESEGTTIEKYFIAQRIEKVKELLVYDELTLSEIAHLLNYSSAAYLSNQFKKVTGSTPGDFKRNQSDKRKPLDEV